MANPDKSTIQKLEREIKEIKEKIRNDKSDNPKPSPRDKKEERVLLSINVEETKGFCMFSNWINANTKEDIKVFRISKSHPQIKELLKEGKLKKDKWFTIRYGKVDKKTDEGITYDFNEFNQELEIAEA